VGGAGWSSNFASTLGIRFFRAELRPILGKRVHDPTSGFVGVTYGRVAGRSSITGLKSFYYIAHVLLGVFMNVLKYEHRLRRGPDAGAGG
jgi:hypothetical protein